MKIENLPLIELDIHINKDFIDEQDKRFVNFVTDIGNIVGLKDTNEDLYKLAIRLGAKLTDQIYNPITRNPISLLYQRASRVVHGDIVPNYKIDFIHGVTPVMPRYYKVFN